MGIQLPKRNYFARQRVTESILPYIREVLTLSKTEKQSFTVLKHGSKRLKYLPSANCDSVLSAYASIFLRKNVRGALLH